MPRIFKGIESELRLLLHPCILTGEITDIKVALFTNDPSVAIEFTDRYTIDDNILTLKVPTWAFGTMEDGVINYVIQGMHNDDAFITDRQSNYYLKTPTDYIPEEMPEEVVLGELTTKIVENGVFEYTPTDVDAWNKATIEVNVPDTNGSYDEGYNQGYEDGQNSVECPECPTCNLGEGEIVLDTTMAGFYELYAAEDGYDGWSKFYVTLENGGAIKVHKAEELIQMFNEGWGIDFGAYCYVGGKITDITEVSMEWGNATYTLDNGFSVYRGKWFDGNTFSDENQIKVGAYIVVYGIIQDYKGVLGFKVNSQVIAYQECEGGEIVSCNLEDKWVTPSMGDRDDNGYVVVEESEGFDGLSRVVIDPTTIYNEGVSAGKAEGGDLIIGTGDIYLTANERGQRFEIFPSEWEYDAFDKFIVELENFDLGGDANIYDALSVNQLLMDGVISYGNRYLFKGQITEIQRIRPEYGDARYTLDGSLNVYNGQTMGYDIQVGDNVIVIGTLSEYNGAPQFSAGSIIKAWWKEGGSGNCDDAYNSGYNQGYYDAENNAGSTARVLEVTENGNYLSKFSDPIIPLVTGVYDDGTEFYSYARLNGAVYNTKIAGSIDSRLEFWYKGDNTRAQDGFNVIIGSGDYDNSDCFQVRYYMYSNDKLRIELGSSIIEVSNWDDTVWHHLIISKAEGLWIDGEKKGDFTASNTVNGEFFINGIKYDNGGARNANGTFGMIKIDDVVIIPTADGFRNVNTGELLEIVQNGFYAYAENLPKYGEGELFKTINVNVAPKINIQETGIRLGYSTFTEVPDWVDFEGITDLSNMFNNCSYLKSIEWFNTELVTKANSMFANCALLTTLSNNFNFGYCTDMNNFFANSNSLSDYSFLETWVFNPTATMDQMISNTNTTYVPAIPCVGGTSYYESAIFWSYSEFSKLTYFGGWIGRKYNITKDQILKKLPNLTYESCISILNNLYDFTGNGETPGSNQGTLKVHQNFLDTVGDEISIGTAKGWTITA